MNQFKKLDKAYLSTELLSELYKISSNELTEEELNSMKKRLQHVQNVKEIIEKSRFSSSSLSDVYKHTLLTMTLDIIDNREAEADNLHTLYLRYMEFILPYVFDMLNTKELKNDKRHIKKIHKVLIKKYMEIAEYYEKGFEEFFEEELVH